MTKAILSLCVGVWLFAGLAGSVRAAPLHVAAPVHLTDRAVIAVDDMPPFVIPDLNKIDPRLVFLGAGILTGLLLASPSLEVGEVLGVALGVIGSEYLYHNTFEKKPEKPGQGT